MRIVLIANAKDPAEVEVLRGEVSKLRTMGHEVSPHLTFESGDARRMAGEAAAAGADLLIAAGGDGTLNEVANGLVGALRGGVAGVPRLGVVPLGTANDLAHELEIPADAAAAFAIALAGEALEVDVGTVGERCFLNVSSGGIGAEATEETPPESKRALGALAYVVTGVRKFASLEVSEARFASDELIYEGPFLLFAVGNSRRTGGGNLLTPRAEMWDRLLDLCIVRECSRMEFLKLMPALRSGEHLDHPAVIYRQVERVRVESPGELSVNADGEPLAGRSYDYAIAPERLTVMVPRKGGGG